LALNRSMERTLLDRLREMEQLLALASQHRVSALSAPTEAVRRQHLAIADEATRRIESLRKDEPWPDFGEPGAGRNPVRGATNDFAER
jgi:hypothetical protein